MITIYSRLYKVSLGAKVILYYCLIAIFLGGCIELTPFATTAELFYNRHQIHDFFHRLQHEQALSKAIHEFTLDKNNRIKFAETNKRILIYGQVRQNSEKKAVGELIKKLADNKEVNNHLEIKSPINWTQHLKDTWTTTRLKSQYLLENRSNLTQIKVITDDNVIFLIGHIKAPAITLARALGKAVIALEENTV